MRDKYVGAFTIVLHHKLFSWQIELSTTSIDKITPNNPMLQPEHTYLMGVMYSQNTSTREDKA